MSYKQQLSTTFPPSLFESHQDKVMEIDVDTRLLFLADVHLGAHDDEKRRSLEQQLQLLLDYCSRESIRIVILGDLFDYWLEYEGWHSSLGEQLLQHFKSYHMHHPATLYITGNHDHWHQTHLKDCGFEMENEFKILQTPYRTIFAMHGDGLADPTLQLPRSYFNRVLRSSFFNKLYRTLLPPSVGISIMKYISAISKWLESEQEAEEQKILIEWAHQLIKQTSIDAVVCGHNHKAQVFSFREGMYLNTGAFAQKFTLGRYTNNNLDLVRWDVSSQQVHPDV